MNQLATTRKHHPGVEQGALTLAALVALYLIWLGVGLPALALPAGGRSSADLHAVTVTQIAARTSSLPKLDATRPAATVTKTHARAQRAPHVLGTVKTWPAPPTPAPPTPAPAPAPTPAPPTHAPATEPPATPAQTQQPPAQQQEQQPPPPPTTLPELPQLPDAPEVPDVPLPPLPTVTTPQLPQLPTTTLPSLP